MKAISKLLLFSLASTVTSLWCDSARAQASPPTTPSFGGAMPASEKVIPGIGWYGVLSEGIAESKRTGKPIFFLTAAPQCGGVPGMW
ncbi:MAG: hypothetical protein AAF357_12780 [Verrucomicrobiota bacterium]